MIFYETGPRLLRSLDTLAQIWPEREVCVARELTKLHEECRSDTADNLASYYREHPPKGEIVLMVAPPIKTAMTDDPDTLLSEALIDHSPSKAAGLVAKATGLDRQTLYARAVELRAKSQE